MCLCIGCILLTGCVTPNNSCGNEERDWNNLNFPKNRYCSVPSFLPFADYYEAANKAVCKVHDNNSGKFATMRQSEADRRFLCDYMKHIELPTGLRTVTGYASYLFLRLGAPDESLRVKPTNDPVSILGDSDQTPIRDSQGNPVRLTSPLVTE